MSGRYASYWNAFLLTHAIRPVESSISSNYFLLKSLVTFPCIVKYLQKEIQF